MPGTNFSFLPFQIAQTKGLYNREGLEVQHVLMRGTLSVPALVNGEVDFVTNFNILIHAAIRGLPVRIVFVSAARQMYHLMVQPNIKTVGDLRGKLIGTSGAAAAPTIATREILRAFGIDPEKEVQMIIGADEHVRAEQLRRKTIAAAMIQPPMSIILKNEGFRLLVNAGDYLEFPVSALGATTAKIRDNPNQIKRVLRALYAALLFIRQERTETVTIIAKWLNIDRAVAAETYDLTAKYLSPDGTASNNAIMERVEDAKRMGKVTKNMTVTDVSDFGLLQSVIKNQ
jgi:ABC-type nitrate/sulfonate/bicarbonate transport system substrate-binding protein